jgi:hypothetical protein
MTMTAEMPTTPTATPRTARRKALPHADVTEMTDNSVWVCQKSGPEFGAFALMMTGPNDDGRCHLWHPVSRRNTYPRISTVSEHWRKATAEEEAAFRHQYGTAPLGLPAGTDMDVFATRMNGAVGDGAVQAFIEANAGTPDGDAARAFEAAGVGRTRFCGACESEAREEEPRASHQCGGDVDRVPNPMWQPTTPTFSYSFVPDPQAAAETLAQAVTVPMTDADRRALDALVERERAAVAHLGPTVANTIDARAALLGLLRKADAAARGYTP